MTNAPGDPLVWKKFFKMLLFCSRQNACCLAWYLATALAWTTRLVTPMNAQETPTLDLAYGQFQTGRLEDAQKTVTKFIEENADNASAFVLRAQIHESRKDFSGARSDYDRWIELTPQEAQAWNRRGGLRFKAGDVKGSIEDFDRAISLDENLERPHWQRGLSYYYDGRFAEGAKQFELYQTYDATDVENVVWKFLCQARYAGIEKSRQDMLPLEQPDQRIPMMQIDALYRGRGSVEDVLVALEQGNPTEREQRHRSFYAHLYLGLYFEVLEDEEQARQHLLEADRLEIGHYMWYVAHLHAARIRGRRDASGG
ncbi:MAG: hypothetical protein CMJ81_20125 [Planctomycetaceae bacterium]|nr:hypothetical protein [Planctomycetaceae bacterium]